MSVQQNLASQKRTKLVHLNDQLCSPEPVRLGAPIMGSQSNLTLVDEELNKLYLTCTTNYSDKDCSTVYFKCATNYSEDCLYELDQRPFVPSLAVQIVSGAFKDAFLCLSGYSHPLYLLQIWTVLFSTMVFFAVIGNLAVISVILTKRVLR